MPKRKKTTTADTSSATIILGNLIKDNFRNEDVSNWSKRGKVEDGFCFKQTLGERFFHGLDQLNSLEGENSGLQSSVTSTTISRDYYKGLVDGAEKKVEDERQSHKSALKALQDDLTKVKVNAKATGEAQQMEIDRLKERSRSSKVRRI